MKNPCPGLAGAALACLPLALLLGGEPSRADDALPTLLPGFPTAAPWTPAAAAGRGIGEGGFEVALLEAAPRPAAMAQALGAGGSAPEVDPVTLTSPIVSGLRWRSGAKCSDCAGFAAWRKRPIDVVMLYVDHASWASMATFLAKPFYKQRVKEAPQAVVSMPMLPKDQKGQHAACAAGAFDGYYRQFGSLLVGAGAPTAVVRLGWEANIGSNSHPWGIDTAEQIPNYIACFRREAAALKSTAPGLKIEWTSSKRSWAHVNTLSFYPGDDVVDIWGIHYYDTDPEKNTQAAWDQAYNATLYGGPWGIGSWFTAAQARGYKLAVSEWAIRKEPRNPVPDDPVYIANMYNTFKNLASSVEYESYFNNLGEHQLWPTTAFPQAAATYQRLWSAGQ